MNANQSTRAGKGPDSGAGEGTERKFSGLTAGAGSAAGAPTGEIEVRHLLSFRAVAGEGSFHEAAEDLGYTQSAVSQHVAALEAALGLRLLERSRGKREVRPTEAGELLLRHADAIAARIEAAQADMRAYAAGETGVLRIATYQSVGARILPAVIGRFAELWPRVEVRLTESHTDAGLPRLLEGGELDLTFGVAPLPPGPFDGVELLRDPYVLVVGKRSPYASLVHPTLQEIGALPLLSFRSCPSQAAAYDVLRQAGPEPRFVLQTDDNSTIQGMAAAGVGAAIVPLLAVDQADPSVIVLATDLPPRVVTLAWHRDRHQSPALVEFVDLAIEVCEDLERTLAVPQTVGGRRLEAAALPEA